VGANWRVYNTSLAAHPVAAVGSYDLDEDGIVGETPQNDDPNPGSGWDESDHR
jgi:hypothetical protein